MVLTCTAAGACNAWRQTTSCGASSLVCGVKSGGASCECGANPGATFSADAVNGSAAGAAPYPTGLLSPMQCRFKTITAALTQANAAAAASGSGLVQLTGQTGAGTEVFNAETFPLNVNSNVTLNTSDTPPVPANYVINFTDATSGQNAILLHDLGHLAGFTVQNVNGAANSTGIGTSCPASPLGAGTVTDVVVNGKSAVVGNPAMANGLNVISNCSVVVDSSDFKNAGFGIRLIATANNTAVTATNGNVDGNLLGILALRGTLTLTGTNIRNSSLEGIRINPTGGEVVFAQTGGIVESNVQGGLVFLSGGTNASTATVTNTEIRNNGSSSSSAATYYGVATTAARPVTLAGVNVHNNAAGGLTASASAGGGSPVVVLTNGTFGFNGTQTVAGPGLNASGAGTSVAATGTSFSSNRGAGVHVGGGAVGTFSAVVVNGNSQGANPAQNPGGFEVEAGTATVTGASTIQRNAFNGVKESSGTLTVTGTATTAVDVSINGVVSITQPQASSGLYLGNGTFTGSFISSHDNGNHGIEVFNTGPNPVGQPITLTSCSFASNPKSGMHVDVSSPIAATGANSLNVSQCTFTNNLHGLNLAASNGNIHAAFQANTISGSGDTGVYVNSTQTSVLNFNGNTILNNKATTLFGGQGVGGILFTGMPPNPVGNFSFTSNQVHHNSLNQVVVFAQNGGSPPSWFFNGTAGVSCNAATANTFSCYNSLPGPSASVGIAAVGPVTVQANGNAWQNAAPAAGTDFSTAASATFSPSPPTANCAASAITCP
jgi:hypothetical protein